MTNGSLAEVDRSTMGAIGLKLSELNNVDKEVDFDKDILTSKTLQLLIYLLDKLHATKLLPLLNSIEKPLHLNELITSCLTIVENYLNTIQKRQNKKVEELNEKTKQDPSKAVEIGASIYGQMQFQPLESVILTGSCRHQLGMGAHLQWCMCLCMGRAPLH